MGLVYFITGTNRGIGLELVKQLLQDPSNHVIATIRQTRDFPELSITKNSNLTILTLDYGAKDPKQTYDKLQNELERLSLGIDVFIANAAQNTAKTDVLNTHIDEYVDFFRVNTLGPVKTLNVLKPYMLKKRTRKVVFTSSVLGSISEYPYFLVDKMPCASYCVSKAGLNFFTKSLSLELKDEEFIVISYHPGLVRGTRNDDSKPLCQRIDNLDKKTLEYISSNTLTTEQAASYELSVIAGLESQDSGKFLTFNKSEIPY